MGGKIRDALDALARWCLGPVAELEFQRRRLRSLTAKAKRIRERIVATDRRVAELKRSGV